MAGRRCQRDGVGSLKSCKTMKEAYAVRRTVPPSAEIEARIDQLLAVGVGDDPRETLAELATLLDRGRAEAKANGRVVPAIAAEAIVGGAWQAVHLEVAAGRVSRLPHCSCYRRYGSFQRTGVKSIQSPASHCCSLCGQQLDGGGSRCGRCLRARC